MNGENSYEKELDEFVNKLNDFSIANCPSFIESNSFFVGIIPGHNLDLLQISFDFRITRSMLLKAKTPDILKDISKPNLKVLE